MALGAIVAKRGLVRIFMTSGAICGHPQERVLALFEFSIGYVIRLVASAAIHLRVLSGEGIVCQIVVKILFIEAHHIEIAPMVIAMAAGAILTLDCRRHVKTFVFVHPRFDFFVAIEAFLVRNFFAQVVALRTIGNTFQCFVRIG